ncbi:MAG: type II toxin-antitoxin system MqsA family antitoxin [Desulfonauticus sp.]|nr:type II toxin-antitoxin system MqsA family antitoxin [Desulfonauticus sp.]
MYKNGEVCPICGSGKIKVEKKEEVFEYKGKKLSLYLTVYSCDECKEGFFDNKEMKKYQKIINDFQRKVDGLFTLEQIQRDKKI